LKQLLYILTISADGAVPIAYRTADGNTPDDRTHIPTFDELVRLVGTPSFLYADSTLCSSDAMRHIDANGDRFVTDVPHGRKRTPSSRTGSRPMCPPERRRTADPVLASKIPTGCGGPSRHRFPPPTATG
jgi:transposase